MLSKVKDIWGHEIKNGDFVVSASKSSESMVMGVMVDVEKQTRIRIDEYRSSTGVIDWRPATRAARVYTLDRTLKLSDEMILQQNPALFEVMAKVRESVKLPTNRKLIAQQKMLRAYLDTLAIKRGSTA